MSSKTRGNYPVTICITKEPCVNRDKKCKECISKSCYEPQEVNNDISSRGSKSSPRS